MKIKDKTGKPLIFIIMINDYKTVICECYKEKNIYIKQNMSVGIFIFILEWIVLTKLPKIFILVRAKA